MLIVAEVATPKVSSVTKPSESIHYGTVACAAAATHPTAVTATHTILLTPDTSL